MNSHPELDQFTRLPLGPVVSSSARRPDAPLLQGKSVRLERLQPLVHGDALWEAAGGLQQAALWQYLSEGPFADREQFDAALTRGAGTDDALFFAIVDQLTNRALGRCAYLNIRPEQGVVEVGHLLFSPLLQRTRAATETLYLLAKHAFEDLGYRRYEWKCNALNAKSRQAAERSGFVFEGIFRQHMIVKGRSRDSAWFSILDREWPPVRSAFEHWLAADNFDSRGQQIQRLGEFLAAARS